MPGWACPQSSLTQLGHSCPYLDPHFIPKMERLPPAPRSRNRQSAVLVRDQMPGSYLGFATYRLRETSQPSFSSCIKWGECAENSVHTYKVLAMAATQVRAELKLGRVEGSRFRTSAQLKRPARVLRGQPPRCCDSRICPNLLFCPCLSAVPRAARPAATPTGNLLAASVC